MKYTCQSCHAEKLGVHFPRGRDGYNTRACNACRSVEIGERMMRGEPVKRVVKKRAAMIPCPLCHVPKWATQFPRRGTRETRYHDLSGCKACKPATKQQQPKRAKPEPPKLWDNPINRFVCGRISA